MAKDKGKSQRRIKDWQQRYQDDAELQAAARRQRLTPPAVKLREERFAASTEDLGNLPQSQGMVVGFFPGGAIVRIGHRLLPSGIAKTFRAPEGASPLAVGDNVTVAMSPQEHKPHKGRADKDRAAGMILSRQPRKTVLSRPQGRSDKRRDAYAGEVFEKVIVANMDALLIVAATRQPALWRGLIDRYLIIADRGGLRPVLVINKIDLRPPDEQLLADFAAMGIDVFACSALKAEGISALRASSLNRRSVLAGASGVGKSTLINAMVPSAAATVRPLGKLKARGRHTTTAAAIYDLPEGGMIVDTPGVRELGLQLEAAEVPWYFPEFEKLTGQCRFNDCTHTHEPGCAVIAAVQTGVIPPRRYDSYLRILETLEENKG